MKRGYTVTGNDKTWAVPVVARTSYEAKLAAWKKWNWEFDCDWIDLRVLWRRDATVDDLPFGVVENETIAYRNKMIDYIWR